MLSPCRQATPFDAQHVNPLASPCLHGSAKMGLSAIRIGPPACSQSHGAACGERRGVAGGIMWAEGEPKGLVAATSSTLSLLSRPNSNGSTTGSACLRTGKHRWLAAAPCCRKSKRERREGQQGVACRCRPWCTRRARYCPPAPNPNTFWLSSCRSAMAGGRTAMR